jgi:hypothetical protein
LKAVKRWRYYCDHCKKAGQSGGHIKKHEDACTLNPERKCRMCPKIAEGAQASMADMLALLPDPAIFMRTITAVRYHNGFEWDEVPAHDEPDDEAMRAATHAALPALRELVNHCPVCIMAALRQKKIPLPVVTDFNFTEELKSMWTDINSAEEERFY